MSIDAVVRSLTLVLCAVPAVIAADDPVLVSLNQSGGAATAWSPRLSADGRYVLFISAGTDIVPGASTSLGRVYVRDMLLGVTECCSVDTDGVLANGPSEIATMSADARWVTFASSATNLPPSPYKVYMRDRQSHTTVAMSSYAPPQLSDDAAWGVSTKIESPFPSQVLIEQLATGATELVSIGPGGQPGDSISTTEGSLQAISADGRYVVFASGATNFVTGVPAGVQQVYVRDRVAGSTTLVSATPAGEPGVAHSGSASISADGRVVAFSSTAFNLGGLPHGSAVQVYARDLQTGTLELMSVSNAGAPNQANPDYQADIQETTVSGDGRFVAFELMTNNLAPPLTVPQRVCLVRDRLAGLTLAASVDQDGGSAFGYDPVISRDGRFVSFWTPSALAAPDVWDSAPDAYLYDRAPWTEIEPGLAGSAGVPRLVMLGAPSPHAPVTLAITHTQPFALAQLVIGFGQANVPFKGGTMVPVPTVLLPLPTNAQGLFLIKTDWPAGVPAGTPLALQAWMLDVAGPAGFAATNGVANIAQ